MVWFVPTSGFTQIGEDLSGECVFATHQVLFLQLRVSHNISKRRSTVELSLFYQSSLVIGSSTVRVPNEWFHFHQLVVLRSSRICLLFGL